MAIIIKEVISADTIEQLIEKINFNFDQIQNHGGGPQGSVGPVGTIGFQGSPGVNGVYWFIANNLTTFFAAPPSLQTNDLILITEEHTYNLTLYTKGDIVRVTILPGPITTLTIIGNIKPDNIITPTGTSGILETIFDGLNEVYHRNVTETAKIPIILSTADVTATNDLLTDLRAHILANNNLAALYIYGNDATGGGGKLTFLYGEGTATFSIVEIENAPSIHAVINTDQLSLRIHSYHNLINEFQDDYRITTGLVDYLKIDTAKNWELFLTDTKTFSIFGSINKFFIASNNNVGLGTVTPQQKLEISGNVRLTSSGFIQAGTNINQLYLDSATGFIGLNTATPTSLLTLSQLNNKLKFVQTKAVIEGPTTSTVVAPGGTYNFYIQGGNYSTTAGVSSTGASIIIKGGDGNTNPTPPLGSLGGNAYLYGGTGRTFGNTILAYNNDLNTVQGRVGVNIFNPRTNLEVLNKVFLTPLTGGSLVSLSATYEIGKTSATGNSASLLISTDSTIGLGLSSGDISIIPGSAAFAGGGGNLTLETLNASAFIKMRTKVGGNILLQVTDADVATGNVGIGTLTPTERLSVKGNVLVDNTATTDVILNGSSLSRLKLYKTGQQTFMIESNHGAGITTTYTLPEQLLRLRGDGLANPTTEIVNDNSLLTDILLVNASSASITSHRYIQFSSNGTITGQIERSGGATLYSTASDIRLKTELKPLTNSKDILEKINIYNYKWKKDGTNDVGVIAQEVNKVYPYAVTTNAEENTRLGLTEADTDYKYMSVDYSKLVPLLIQRVKELTKEVDKLINK